MYKIEGISQFFLSTALWFTAFIYCACAAGL